MNKNTPPSEGYQLWGLMLLVFLLSVIANLSLIIVLFWPTNDWGSFLHHATHFMNGVWALLEKHSWIKLKSYNDILTSYGLRNVIALTAACGLIISSFISFKITCLLLWVPGGRKSLVKIKGPTLFDHSQLKKSLTRRNWFDRKENSIAVHPDLLLSKKEIEGNIFVFGQQGSGKSVIIKQILNQIASRGNTIVIYDEKREYTELFYDPNDTVLIAPWDQRSAVWNISSDIINDEDCELIAKHLVSDKANDPMWSNGARAILAGILTLSRVKDRGNWGWQQVVENLSLDNQSLREWLDIYYERAARFIEADSKTTQGFISTLMADIAWMYSLADAWAVAGKTDESKIQFSIRDWLGGKLPHVKKVIIQSHPEFKYIGAPLCNAMIGLMTNIVLAKPDEASTDIWLVLDELGNLPKNDSLSGWLSIGRSKGCRTLAGTQSISQLHSAYGTYDTDTLLNLFSTIVALRCGSSGGVAEYAAKSFGEALYERPSVSTDSRGNVTTNWHKENWPLVTATDLTNLPQPSYCGVTGYITSSGWNAVYRLQWPYPQLNRIAQSHVSAEWLTNRGSKSTSTKNGRLRYN
jgi:type IV secretory pathway TraG/TraD family ATPase VirD4